MKRQNQSGFAHVGAVLLVIIVLAVLGGGGYYVYHKNKTKNDANTTTNNSSSQGKDGSGLGSAPANKTDCGLEGEYKGKYLISYNSSNAALFGFCAPNGWTLGEVTGSPVFLADASGLKYKADADVKVNKVGAGDGARAFGVYYNTSADRPPEGLTKVGTVEAAKLTGTEYYKLHDTDETGLGAVPKGTKEYAYYFAKEGKSVLVTYNIFPGDTDNLALVNKLVKTVNID